MTQRKRKFRDQERDINSGVFLKRIKPLNKKQEEYIQSLHQSVITLCSGDAGTGKTLIAVYEALKLLLDNKIDKLIISRPMIECGSKMGHLPGTDKEKIHPYLKPILDLLEELIGKQAAELLIENGEIEVSPLGFTRGLTFKNCVSILTEAQNCSFKELKMWLTRLGENSRMIIEGDCDQSDIFDSPNPFSVVMDKLDGIDAVSIVEFTEDDIVRHPLIKEILKRLK